MSQSQKSKRKWISNSNELGNLKVLKNMGYTLGGKIGQGTYSTVCLANRRNKEIINKCACKIINKKIAGLEFIQRFLPRELQIIATLNHPHVVKVFNIIEINEVIYIFMDYCKHGDMLEYIRQRGALPENRAKRYFKQIVDAMEYLHMQNVAHRDLKCENILLAVNRSIKLGDFGFARSCVNPVTGKLSLSNTFCGSAAYAAPEILQGIPYNPKMYDIWALGCVLYIMMTACMPFDDSNIRRMLKSQLSRSARRQNIWTTKANSKSLESLLDTLLEPDVRKRATITDVVNCKWLREANAGCKRVIVRVSDTKIA